MANPTNTRASHSPTSTPLGQQSTATRSWPLLLLSPLPTRPIRATRSSRRDESSACSHGTTRAVRCRVSRLATAKVFNRPMRPDDAVHFGRFKSTDRYRCVVGCCTGRAPAREPGRPAAHGPGLNDILRAGPGAGLKLAGPGRARAGK